MPRKQNLKFKNGIAHDPMSGNYHIRITIGGKRISRVVGSRRQAEAIVRGFKNKKITDDLRPVGDGNVPSLGECLADFIADAEDRDLALKTLQNYRAVRSNLERTLSPCRQLRLQNRDVSEYARVRRSEGVSKKTIESELGMLRSAIKAAVGPDYLAWSTPVLLDSDVAKPRPIPSDSEIAAVYLALEDCRSLQRAVVLGLLTALRQGDVLALESTDIADRVIITRVGKRRRRQIAIPVVPMLAKAIHGVEGSLTAPASSFRAEMRRRTRHMPKPWQGIGKLRSTAASWASAAGFTDKQVGVLLGHRGSTTVARRHYVRSVIPLADPLIELRRAMLSAIEARLQTAIREASK
jgi:integrase